jgi:PHP family Zn ribbon phosphoesterase
LCSECTGAYENPDMTAPEPECEECGHAVSLHTAYGCEYTADRPDEHVGQVAYECGCKFKEA